MSLRHTVNACAPTFTFSHGELLVWTHFRSVCDTLEGQLLHLLCKVFQLTLAVQTKAESTTRWLQFACCSRRGRTYDHRLWLIDFEQHETNLQTFRLGFQVLHISVKAGPETFGCLYICAEGIQ